MDFGLAALLVVVESVKVFFPIADFHRCVAEKGDAALPAVGVAGELEEEIFFAAELVEIIGLVDEGEGGSFGGDSSESAVCVGVAAPDVIKPGDG